MSHFLSIGLIPKPIDTFPPHQHTTWEIVLYTKGKGVATVGDQEIPFCVGTIVCMPPDIPHKERSEAGFTNIHIHATRAGVPFPERIPIFQDPVDRPFFNIASMLFREFHHKAGHWELITQDLFDILILYLSRWRSAERPHPQVEALRNLLVAKFHDSDFSVGDALKRVPLSPDHLRKLFQKAYGKAPIDFLTELRVNEAKHLLEIGGFPVKEVSQRVGFTDPYYFSRVFRKVTGRWPSRYVEAGA